MPLVPADAFPVCDVGHATVHFVMVDGANAVDCCVSFEALERLEPEEEIAGPDDYVVRFGLHRGDIEAAASRKYDASHLVASSYVMVRPTDLSF